MATIRERLAADGERSFHVQVRLTGFPARTETFATRRGRLRRTAYSSRESGLKAIKTACRRSGFFGSTNRIAL
jgi:hypothetical protein